MKQNGFDLILRHGLVFDGSGQPGKKLDVGITADRITALGDLSQAEAPHSIEAAGLNVTPGFIDAHSHSDAYLLLEPEAPSKLSQGITTEVNGQCGGSAAPKLGEARLSSDWASMTYPPATTPGPTWTTMASYREHFEAARPAINSVQFIGHNTLRAGVMGYVPRAATPDEVRKMQYALDQALEEGGWGLSTGLLYQPGKYSETSEVEALARTTARRGGLYATHMRSESTRLLEAVDEVLSLARATGIQVQVSHLKTSGQANWNKIEPLLQKLNGARAEGIKLFSDRYPYVAAGTELDVVFPDWAGAGGNQAELARLADPALRAKIIAEINAQPRDWSTVMIGGAWSDTVRPFCGQSLAAAATALHLTPGETCCRFVEKDLARTGAFFFGMSEENLHRIYEQPWITCGSDASLRKPTGPLGADHPHPRAYGTMPRFFRCLTGRVENFKKIGSEAEAIRRMTSLPASIFGLKDRGLLRVGAYADITVFDPATFRETATYARPHQFCVGIRAVIVNGALAYDKGTFTGLRTGRLLTR